MIKTIIFDFDGVLGDSLDAMVSVINIIGPKYGFLKVTREEIQKSGISGLFQKYKVSPVKLPFLINEGREELNKIIETVRPVKGIRIVLEKLSKIYQLGILSSNSRANLSAFLIRNNWEEYFTFVFSDSSLFGKHRSLIKLLNERKLNKNEVVYIGDEARDIRATKKIGVPIIAVLWGYESKDVLKLLYPDFFAKRPNDLLNLIQNIKKL